ncbi:hypothetical protein CEXT_639751 [Caerostris extrusa]|uniref:Uncharacterized protein n=1 Tax=Caerostris extrusa TaxID=172846 RepID=A0AAV4M8X8_CAEEX|nr:hypothetical protein CEXT_639751 [Caerostris extrusa]
MKEEKIVGKIDDLSEDKDNARNDKDIESKYVFYVEWDSNENSDLNTKNFPDATFCFPLSPFRHQRPYKDTVRNDGDYIDVEVINNEMLGDTEEKATSKYKEFIRS